MSNLPHDPLNANYNATVMLHWIGKGRSMIGKAIRELGHSLKVGLSALWHDVLWNRGFWTFASTIVIAVATSLYTHYARRQLKAINDQLPSLKTQAEAAKSAADTARNALVLANRPWIKIKHRIVKPLNFDFVGAAGPAATITVEDTIENVGDGVALNVTSWEDVIPLDPNMSTTTARRRRDEWCNANKKFDPTSPTELNGYVLFPKEPFVQYSGMGPLMTTVQKAVKDNMAYMELHKGSGSNSLIGKVAFVMVNSMVILSL